MFVGVDKLKKILIYLKYKKENMSSLWISNGKLYNVDFINQIIHAGKYEAE